LRVVDILENEGRGLNLTREVRDGIVHHSKSGVSMLDEWGKVGSLEGEVVRFSDLIAYINHDIDDALRADIIHGRDLPEIASRVLGNSHRERINSMVGDIIEQSWSIRDGSMENPSVKMSREVLKAAEAMREFLFEKVYNMHSAREESERARETVRLLYRYYKQHPEDLPPEYSACSDDPEQRAVDYIAGMTDRYATEKAKGLG
jgi:dGTPase